MRKAAYKVDVLSFVDFVLVPYFRSENYNDKLMSSGQDEHVGKSNPEIFFIPHSKLKAGRLRKTHVLINQMCTPGFSVESFVCGHSALLCLGHVML
ncbi:hypothetical protein BgiMline_026930, partial [Biomphalaria glabrata]